MESEPNNSLQAAQAMMPGMLGGPKKPNTLPVWGNSTTMNLNPLILTNIETSPYFVGRLTELKTYHELVDEINYKVTHLEPWEIGSRASEGRRQTGICGGVVGVGVGGIISSAFCILYKLFTTRLTRKQVYGLLNHKKSPYIRGIGFLYVRFTQPPTDFWEWFEPYIEDSEEINVRAGGGQIITIGEMVRLFVTRLDWFSSLFPRIPVRIQIAIDRKLVALKHSTSTDPTPKKVEEVIEPEKNIEQNEERPRKRFRSRSPKRKSRDKERDIRDRTSRSRDSHCHRRKDNRSRSETLKKSRRSRSRSKTRNDKGSVKRAKLDGQPTCWKSNVADEEKSLEELALQYSETEIKLGENVQMCDVELLAPAHLKKLKKKCDCRVVNGSKCHLDDCNYRLEMSDCPVTCGERCRNQHIRKDSGGYGLELRETCDMGIGVFATKDFKAGDYIITYIGELITEADYKIRLLTSKHSYGMRTKGIYIMDSSEYGNMSRFINHHCVGNCDVIKRFKDNILIPTLWANTDIKAGEQIFYPYQFENFDTNVFVCKCASKFCKYVEKSKQKPVKVRPEKLEVTERLMCVICKDETYKHAKSLKKHLESRHGIDWEGTDEEYKMQKCRKCELVFRNASSYDKHYEEKHYGRNREICHLCDAKFCHKKSLKRHLKNLHGQGLMNSEVN